MRNTFSAHLNAIGIALDHRELSNELACFFCVPRLEGTKYSPSELQSEQIHLYHLAAIGRLHCQLKQRQLMSHGEPFGCDAICRLAGENALGLQRRAQIMKIACRMTGDSGRNATMLTSR